jgi:ribosomal-protein-alanine N-acetyltransferase
MMPVMPHDKIKINYFNEAMAASLGAALHAKCFPEPWDAASFTAVMDTPGALLQVLSIADIPTAFSLYQIVLDEAEILTLGTLPEFRGKGIASQLLKTGLEKLKAEGVKTVFLEVGSQNFPAKRLYIANGFEEIGRRRNYYNHGATPEDAIMMKKNF